MMNKELRQWLVLASAVLPLVILLILYITTLPEALFRNPHLLFVLFFTFLALAWYSVIFTAVWKKWVGEIKRSAHGVVK
ncbi:MAG: hypothetical protein QME47_07600 [Candidatus Thermoplasmatota archaeon]|nr:hypothetical protein [Candidatus Thermoplasmatota archaeon]